MTHALCNSQLKQENRQFKGTCGVSQYASAKRFVPAFRDLETGEVEVSRYADGRTAPMHLISGLPKTWATQCDDKGCPLSLKDSIQSGFVRAGKFFTREEAVAAA